MQGKTLAALAGVLVVLVAPSSGSATSVRKVGASARMQAGLLSQVNALRSARGLVRLRLARGLNAAASAHSRQMVRLGYFGHDSANGASFSKRISSFYRLRGYRSWMVGENLVWASPGLSAARALRVWLASPPHRANLLDPHWREIGLSAVHTTSAPGVYGGLPATIVTADFGVRSR
jgi:uncharacterized protein YkwD